MAQPLPTPNKTFIENDLVKIKEQYLLYSAFVGAIIGSVLFILRVIYLIQNQQYTQMVPLTLAYAFLLVLALIRKIKFQVRLYGLVVILAGIGVFSLVSSGLQGDGRIFLLGAVILLGLFEERRITLIVSSASVLIIILAGVAILTGLIPMNRTVKIGSLLEWIISITVYLLLAAAILIITDRLMRRFKESLQKEKKLDTDLASEKLDRENIIATRTEELGRRNAQMEVASQIARDIASETEPRALYEKTVDLIKDRFGFYHVGIFLLDDMKEYAVLRAATGEAGQKMLERKHRLRSGQEGIVGYTCGTGEARIALDVGADAVHFRNPLLPETRSEMALPLKIGLQVIGALDVQSKLESAFTNEDIRLLQSIADQLAVGIERTRLVDQLQTTITELTSSSMTYTGKAWGSYLGKEDSVISYSYRQDREQKNVAEPAEVKDVHKTGQSVFKHKKESGVETSIVAVPVKVHGQIIGVLDVHFASTNIDADTQEFINTVADRLAVSLDNARLIGETRTRSMNEHLVRDLTTKIQSYTSVDDILKTTAAELGKTLGLSDVQVELHTPEQ